ncbi:glycosyl hydrolase family 76-domain-containing protein [Dendryphion nanum]|uniref:Mannan endo-1,6-alpha-mannosidase n=1 Tax=Dendryphion nanum TaxID=256645 RepID=A0A9P9DZA7_9PLEO|nr:glycosyl hydrolase family 76-domain-containing protein [Dendryphion nanum]
MDANLPRRKMFETGAHTCCCAIVPQSLRREDEESSIDCGETLKRYNMVFKSFFLPLLGPFANALDLDTNNADSIRSVAKTIASGVFSAYNNGESIIVADRGRIDNGEDEDAYKRMAIAWNTFIDYGHLTGDSQFAKNASVALVSQGGPENNFLPPSFNKPGNESTSLWALAALSAEEANIEKGAVTPKWIEYSKNIFNTKAKQWDSPWATCGGGLSRYNNDDGTNKDTVSSGGFFVLAARLALITGEKKYADFADKIYKWSEDQKLVSSENGTVWHTAQFVDDKCVVEENSHRSPVSQGLYAEGAALMYNYTKGGDINIWKGRVEKLVNATDYFLLGGNLFLNLDCPNQNPGCINDFDGDRAAGIRALARSAVYAPFLSLRIRGVLLATAFNEAKECTGEGKFLTCGKILLGKDEEPVRKSVSQGNIHGALSALSAVQALLYQESMRKGTKPLNTTPESKPQDKNNASAASEMAITWTGMALAGLVAVFGILA